MVPRRTARAGQPKLLRVLERDAADALGRDQRVPADLLGLLLGAREDLVGVGVPVVAIDGPHPQMIDHGGPVMPARAPDARGASGREWGRRWCEVG